MTPRLFRPVVDPATCGSCRICGGGCPAAVFPELVHEPDTLRGRAFPGKFPVRPGTPPCEGACPLGQRAGAYVEHLARGRWLDAVLVIRRDNPLAASCGYVCHQPCRAACAAGTVGPPVEIRTLKRFALAYERIDPDAVARAVRSWQAPPRSARVAVVGAGPAGLTAAYHLRLAGVEVTVVDAHDRPGGMLAQAIPALRLPPDALAQDLAFLQALDLGFRTGARVETRDDLETLRRSHDAVILALGTPHGVVPALPGARGPGSLDALAFLRAVASADPPRLTGSVVVVGGGNVAVDAARAAVGCGAPRVVLAYRRGPDEMSADPDEAAEAFRRGVEPLFWAEPRRVERDARGPRSLTLERTRPGPPDADGRPVPLPTGQTVSLETQTVFWAVGLAAHHPMVPPAATSPDGRLHLDEAGRVPGLPDVFGAGDGVTGPGFVTEAMASGRTAASRVLEHLE